MEPYAGPAIGHGIHVPAGPVWGGAGDFWKLETPCLSLGAAGSDSEVTTHFKKGEDTWHKVLGPQWSPWRTR